MRGTALVFLLALGGCATNDIGASSLAPRAAEAIDPRIPVEELAVQSSPSAGLVQRLDALAAEALAGDRAFREAVSAAERLAAAAGPAQSESWIIAQQALSVAVAARAQVTGAMGDIDALAAGRIQQLGGIGDADLAAIESAAARVQDIDTREAETIRRLQGLLAR